MYEWVMACMGTTAHCDWTGWVSPKPTSRHQISGRISWGCPAAAGGLLAGVAWGQQAGATGKRCCRRTEEKGAQEGRGLAHSFPLPASVPTSRQQVLVG